jgi:hypothetical protein
MLRRDLLRLLGGVSALAAIPVEDLLALGASTHARLRVDRSPLGFFDTHQMHTVAAACERIIPATDTPGAFVAECHRFAELIVAEQFTPERQRRFIDGLVDLDQRAAKLHQRLFVQLLPPAQDEILSAVEFDAYLVAGGFDTTFWRDLKWLTLQGYYTSFVGIEQELQTNPVPGRYEGCMTVEPEPAGGVNRRGEGL